MVTRNKRRWLKWAVLVTVLVLVPLWFVGTGAFPFLMWSRLNCREHSVDIRTGRHRTQRFLLWTQVSERVEDTLLSELYQKHFGPYPEPEWRTAYVYSPGTKNSPQYTYNGTLATISLLKVLLEHWNVTPEAEKEIVRTILRLWQEDGRADSAWDYVDAIGGHDQHTPILPGELPDPETLSSRPRFRGPRESTP